MEDAYDGFAGVYDMFMDSVPYEEWAEEIRRTLAAFGIRDGLVLDLGCGTGTMTQLLAEAGYDMIGVDASDQMLARALEKRDASGFDILYLCQSMQAFELYGTVRAVVSVCDSLNYLLTEEELWQTFSLVNNYLDPGGIFYFDMNTEYLYREEIGEATIAENREDGSFIWENEFDAEQSVNTCQLTLFLPLENGLYEKQEEFHIQRAYPTETIIRLLQEAGLEFLGVYDGYTKQPPRNDSTRLSFIAREHGKEADVHVGE